MVDNKNHILFPPLLPNEKLCSLLKLLLVIDMISYLELLLQFKHFKPISIDIC